MNFRIKDADQKLSLLSKDEQRIQFNELAKKYTQENPIGCDDIDGAQYLRHLFKYLPVEDISKYIGHWSLTFQSDKTEEQWIGVPAEWPSTCRMMHAYYHKKAWLDILMYSANKAHTVTANIFAGVLISVHDKQHFTLLDAAYKKEPHSIWFKPEIFTDLNKMPEAVKEKIWLTLTHLKDDDLTTQMATALGWEFKWTIGESLIKEQILDSDYNIRKLALSKLTFTHHQDKITLPPLELN